MQHVSSSSHPSPPVAAPTIRDVAFRVASALTTDVARRPEVADRLERIANSDPTIEYRAQNILDIAEELLGAAAPFAKSRLITVYSGNHPSGDRILALGCIYAAAMGTSWDEGQEAAERSRRLNADHLFVAVANDAGNVVSSMIQLGLIGSTTAAGLGYTTAAAAATWQMGGAVAKTKAIFWALGFGAVAFAGATMIYGVLHKSKHDLDCNTEDRRKGFTSEFGKDLLFAELVVGTRVPFRPEPLEYYRPEPRWRGNRADMRHAYSGAHGGGR